MPTVMERWYGQGDEVGGLHTRQRTDPACEMLVLGGPCGKPATVRANTIDMVPHPRYPSDKYWCPDHAARIVSPLPYA